MRRFTFALSTLCIAFLFSCSQNSSQEADAVSSAETEEVFKHHDAQNAPMAASQETFEAEMHEDGLEKELVCMVNNAFMGKKQFPVEFGDKMYYGCCEMCVNTIQNDRDVRYAKDPLTGKEVDKSQAFIAPEPGHPYGGVLYFESKENYEKYSKKS
ncbi:hypothetical protein KI659_10775 [Litoribacter alkaliphilus]|uniref:MlpB protein n=1 Tax=Litoribacter ruber TaxID=702568 RepID=A0AAP2CIV8_9BACT|nr:hypothetical protein [Litoribacter alkaliphilus]MBS9524499.1 hypothetical protein [Litoribacter alkaliphilus]